jgi:hypothetical protein
MQRRREAARLSRGLRAQLRHRVRRRLHAAARRPTALWSLALAVAFLAADLLRPEVLAPLNLLWFKFRHSPFQGHDADRHGLLFVVTVVPTALIMRLRRRLGTIDAGQSALEPTG